MMIHTYGSNDTGAVGANETGLVLGLEDVGDANHVCKRHISYDLGIEKKIAVHFVPCWGIPSVMLWSAIVNC